MINVIELVLSILSSLLAAATKSGVAQEVIDGIQAAITSLEGVKATPVTYQQLEGLRIKPEW